MSSSLKTALRTAILLIAIAASFVLHRNADLAFPLPWPDESVFLWPAKSLVERGTWIAPQLNGHRPILWMPPGYTVVMAAVFRWTPLSLPMARWTSWLFATGGLIGLFYLHQRQRGALWSLPLLGAIAIAPTWVIAGNIARMEALLFFIAICGFVFLVRERVWTSLGLLTLGLLIHPNGVVFLAAGALCAALLIRRKRIERKRNDWIVFGAVGLAYLAYGALVFRYPDAFVHDMRYQFARKLSSGAFQALREPRTLGLVLGILGAAFASWRVWGRPRPSLYLAAASCAIPILSGEMWYLVFGEVGILLLLAEWLDIAAAVELRVSDFITSRWHRALGWAGAIIIVAACGLSLRLARWLGVTASLRDLPNHLSWDCMKMQSTPYLEESERRVVVGAISRLAQELHAYRVSFDPPADGLLLQSERAEDYLTFHPIFSDEKPDLLVFHLSPHWRDCQAEQAARIQENMKTERPLYVFEKESKPRWLIWKALAGNVIEHE